MKTSTAAATQQHSRRRGPTPTPARQTIMTMMMLWYNGYGMLILLLLLAACRSLPSTHGFSSSSSSSSSLYISRPSPLFVPNPMTKATTRGVAKMSSSSLFFRPSGSPRFSHHHPTSTIASGKTTTTRFYGTH